MVSPAPNLWDLDSAGPAKAARGLYVAVSGNTAAGKSSLIAEIETRLRRHGVDALGVSERQFHHPYLRLMFSHPAEFSFGIQLTFLLQRHLVLLRNLVQLRRIVLIERSHFDDTLFVEEHCRSGNIDAQQRHAYDQLAEVLHSRIPAPDLLVLMNPTPESSLQRLAAAEASGQRPKEFPSEQVKEAWVRRWHGLYIELHARYRKLVEVDPHWTATRIVELDPQGEFGRVADAVEVALEGLLAPWREGHSGSRARNS